MSEDFPKCRQKIDQILKTDSLPKFRKIFRHGSKPKNMFQQMSRLFIFLLVEKNHLPIAGKRTAQFFPSNKNLLEKATYRLAANRRTILDLNNDS